MMFLLLLLSCLPLASTDGFKNKTLLTFQDCDGDVICLVQKSCLVKGSTEFHTLVRWSGKIKGNLSECTGIRFSADYTSKGQYTFRIQLQIRNEKGGLSGFRAYFAEDYEENIVYECFDAAMHPKDYFNGGEVGLLYPAVSLSEDQGIYHINVTSRDTEVTAVNNVVLCDSNFTVSRNITLPLYNSHMRIFTDSEMFTYTEDDFWDTYSEMAFKEYVEPLTSQYIQCCITILLVYSITVYILDRYCRRLQYTTMDRAEMEEYFFPPAKYRNKLTHFRMLRSPTQIEKEKNIAAVPEDILIDYES